MDLREELRRDLTPVLSQSANDRRRLELARHFMKDEAFNRQDRTLRRYLHPEL